jgi:hypothetical protein
MTWSGLDPDSGVNVNPNCADGDGLLMVMFLIMRLDIPL